MKRMMIAMMLFVTMVTPQTAGAAPRCPNGGTATPSGGCVYHPAGMTCAWPFRLVKVGKVALCVKWEKVQQ